MAVRSYDELSGASGRQIYFRAERFPARRLFDAAPPRVAVAGHSCRLADLSMTGLAAIGPETVGLDALIGQDVDLELSLAGNALFEGRATVVRTERTATGTKLGLALRGTYLDLPELASAHKKVSTSALLAGAGKLDEAAVPADYRRLVADVLHLLRRSRKALDDAEREAARANGAAAGMIDDLLEECEETVLPTWRAQCREGNRLVSADMDPEALIATKDFTELMLTPEVLCGPIWRRAYEKPLGYPGDHEVMAYIYEWQRRGDTAYARLVHRLGLEIMECVRTRMDVVEEILAREARAHQGDAPFRVANLACGSAQEMVNHLAQDVLPAPIEATLIDQGQAPLDHAFRHTYPHVLRHKGAAAVRCYQAAFAQLLKADTILGTLPKQDVIYSIGLFDYLKERRAQRLTAALFEHVAPGGLLVIGNLTGFPLGRWSAEFVTDWTMIYRTEAEIRAFGAGLEAAEVELCSDRLNEVTFVCLRKGS